MDDKSKLLLLAVSKISGDTRFMAFVISAYKKLENLDDDKMLLFLDCDHDTYYKLQLCQAPEPSAIPNLKKDFDLRVNKIAEYTKINPFKLFTIINTYNSKKNIQLC